MCVRDRTLCSPGWPCCVLRPQQEERKLSLACPAFGFADVWGSCLAVLQAQKTTISVEFWIFSLVPNSFHGLHLRMQKKASQDGNPAEVLTDLRTCTPSQTSREWPPVPGSSSTCTRSPEKWLPFSSPRGKREGVPSPLACCRRGPNGTG